MAKTTFCTLRPEKCREHDDEGQERDAERDVGEPHQHLVDIPAEIARYEPDDGADGHDGHRRRRAR